MMTQVASAQLIQEPGAQGLGTPITCNERPKVDPVVVRRDVLPEHCTLTMHLESSGRRSILSLLGFQVPVTDREEGGETEREGNVDP